MLVFLYVRHSEERAFLVFTRNCLVNMLLMVPTEMGLLAFIFVLI